MFIFIEYIFWHYAIAPFEIIKIAKNYFIYVWHKFYILNHLKTLFLPWHRQQLRVEPKTIGEKILIATAGRLADFYFLLVAAFVRFLIVISGLISEIFVLIGLILVFIFWIFWPIIFVYLSFLGITKIEASGFIYLTAAVILLLIIFRIFYHSFHSRPQWMSLDVAQKTQVLVSYNAAKTVSASASNKDLFGNLAVNSNLKFIFQRLNINGSDLTKIINAASANPLAPGVILTSANAIREKHGHMEITSEDLLVASSLEESLVQEWLKINIESEDIDNICLWSESLKVRAQKSRRFWDLDDLLRATPIGQTWTYGFTPFLNEFAQSILTDKNIIKSVALIGRKKEVAEIERVLSKQGENNILLVGDPGVGKESIIMGFGYLVALGKTLPALDYKRVLNLSVPLLVSRFKNLPDIQTGILRILNEAEKAGNIILVIENIHNFIGSSDLGIGKADISEILIPYLASSHFQVIGTTDPVNFHKYIENRPEFAKVFSRINVEEPSAKDTMIILEEAVPDLEKTLGIFFTYQAIKSVAYLSEKYIHTAPNPEKALDLLSEIATYVKNQKRNLVLTEDAEKITSQISRVPIGINTENEKNLLLNLENIMHENLINQDEAIKIIAESLRRIRSGLAARHRPIGAFLLIGPTGVGKTETAKVLAKQYFGLPERVIRFDMAEYQEKNAVSRFIGSLETNEPGQFISKVRDYPSSLVLLDEIEKADRNLINIFLTVLDEGYLNDVYGRKVNMEQTIIIATSNAGSEMIRQMVEQNIDPESQKDKIVDYLLKNNYFAPEFLNRFDAIVVYHPLSKENLLKVAELLLSDLKKRLKDQGYLFEISDDMKNYIVEKGYDPEFGARPMKRVIVEKIESPISRKIIEGSLKKGEKFSLSRQELE